MKVKLKDLNPNPFKKEINGGKLNEKQIESLTANIDKLNLMGAIPIVKINGKYYLVSHHHRVEALKRKFGKNYEVNVVLHDYNNDQLIRGMVIENLTQRTDDFHEVTENIVAVRNYLNKNPEVLERCRESRQRSDRDGMRKEYKDKAVANDIAQWLDESTGKIISQDKILNCLNIKDNLDEELFEQVINTQSRTAKEREDALQETQAIYLSKFKDKKEQKDIADALKKSIEQRVREQGKLISAYKDSSEDIKQKVRKGEIDLAEIENEKLNQKSIKIKNAKDREIRIKRTEEMLWDLRNKINTEFNRINKLMFLVGRIRKTKLYLQKPKEKEEFFRYLDGIISRVGEWSSELRNLKDNLELEVIAE